MTRFVSTNSQVVNYRGTIRRVPLAKYASYKLFRDANRYGSRPVSSVIIKSVHLSMSAKFLLTSMCTTPRRSYSFSISLAMRSKLAASTS